MMIDILKLVTNTKSQPELVAKVLTCITDKRVIVWTLITLVDRYLRPKIGRLEIASTINAGILTGGGFYGLYQLIKGHDAQPTVNWVKYSGLIYYLLDCLTARPEMVFHHLLYFAMVYYQPDMPGFSISAFLLDVPITFLNVAMYLMSKKLPVPLWMKIIIVVTYFITRLVIFPISIGMNWSALSKATPILPWVYTALAVMGAYWFKLLIAKV